MIPSIGVRHLPLDLTASFEDPAQPTAGETSSESVMQSQSTEEPKVGAHHPHHTQERTRRLEGPSA
jgi:hypothetical protein